MWSGGFPRGWGLHDEIASMQQAVNGEVHGIDGQTRSGGNPPGVNAKTRRLRETQNRLGALLRGSVGDD